eukprot:TRINITY_DN777926_c0_g1_i1.p1 TRINITY_DN777926_c0_g1~~TRINITY_DN777926_c0_g1_i1.p1  ORF type:complete len:159 (-),score=12.55 TRINITY_DN777926_c0_g1_i1:248-724(-)
MQKEVQSNKICKSRKRKRVGWAADEFLEQVKEFESENIVVKSKLKKYENGKAIFPKELFPKDLFVAETSLNNTIPGEYFTQNVEEVVKTKVKEEIEVEYEWFCDYCDETILENEIRYECKICSDEFCICSSCFEKHPHEHPLFLSSKAFHITALGNRY